MANLNANVVDDNTARQAGFSSLDDWRNQTGRNNPSNNTSSAPSSSIATADPNAVLNQMKAQQDALTAKQAAYTQARFQQNATDIGNFNTTFQNAVQGGNGQPSLGDQINARYGVPQAVARASQGQQQIDMLGTNANNAGAGGYASAGQVNGALGQLGTREAIAQNASLGVQNLASQEYTRELAPYQTQAQMLNDRLARESTSYSTQQQQQLDALVNQMNSGVALSATQLKAANDLAVAEKGYQAQLQQLQNQQQFQVNTLLPTELKNNLAGIGASIGGQLGNEKAVIDYTKQQNADALQKALGGKSTTANPPSYFTPSSSSINTPNTYGTTA